MWEIPGLTDLFSFVSKITSVDMTPLLKGIGELYTNLDEQTTVAVKGLLSARACDLLTPAEIVDVKESWREIEEGRAKKFRSVNEFLEELKS